MTTFRAIAILFIVYLSTGITAHAVDCDTIPPPVPISLDSLHTFEFTTFGGSDCWGYEAPDGTEYAIMGVAEGVAFANVTTLQVVQIVPGPTAGCGSIRWRDMVTYKHYCYCVSECTGTNEGIMIIDLQYLPDSVHFVGSYVRAGDRRSHNMAVDTSVGYAYAVKQSYSGFRIIDLADPEAPVDVLDVSTIDLHDIYARNDTVWAAEGNRGSFSIWDVSNKATAQLLARVSVPNAGYVHNIWTTEETAFKTIKIWNTEDLNNIQLVGQDIGPSQLAHNAHVLGDYVISSHYETGVQVMDLSVPECPREVALFDTWPSSETPNFNGCWGAFPYTNSGKIYASNEDGKLFVLQSNITGVSFTATPTVGWAPLPVDFTDLTLGSINDWNWQFGDGDSAVVSDPQHVYQDPGLFNVALTVTGVNGMGTEVKPNFVTVLAETLKVTDTTLEANVSAYWEVYAQNNVPLKEIVLPITVTNVPSVVFFDSISFVGTRLDYFELKQVVFDNRFAGQLAMRVRADNGGGSPALAPGDGPIARVYVRTRSFATAGQTATMSTGTLGVYTLTAKTVTTDYAPEFNGATLTIAAAPCDCAQHGDLSGDGVFDALDLNELIDYVFFSGTQPLQDATCPHIDRGDYNCDGVDDALDLNYLIDLLFFSGPPPCDPCACTLYPSDCP